MAKKTTKTASKTPTKKPTTRPKANKQAAPVREPRRLKMPTYKPFRLSKRIKHPAPGLSSSWRLLGKAFGVLKANRRLFGGILLVYIIATLVLVRGLSNGANLDSAKHALGVMNEDAGQLTGGVALFSFLVGSASSATTPVGGLYQSIIMLLVSLALILGLRQVHSDDDAHLSVKEAFYKSTYPLVPFMLVLIAIGVQLLPLVVGGMLYGVVNSNGLAVGGAEVAFWLVIFALLAILSLYMVTSSVFALYIVTLPGMTPLAALRSSRELVRYRRWTVLRKLLGLPFLLLIIAGLIMIPLIVVFLPAAEFMFALLAMVGLAVVHAYMYTLYRELLNGS